MSAGSRELQKMSFYSAKNCSSSSLDKQDSVAYEEGNDYAHEYGSNGDQNYGISNSQGDYGNHGALLLSNRSCSISY